MAEICPIAERGFWSERSRSQRGLAHILSSHQSANGFIGHQTLGWLIGLDGVHIGEDFRLQDGTITIGAGWNAGVVLTAPGLSSSHAAISSSTDSCMIRDIGGREGVLVNGTKVSREFLQDGDEIGIGGQRLMYRSAKAEAPGYRPKFRPRPHGVPIMTAVKRRYVAGWLLGRNGAHMGQDFRLLIGSNTVGVGTAIEVALADAGILDRHLVLQATKDRGIISATETASDVLVNGKKLSGDRSIVDSDVLTLNNIEFLVKWF